MATLPAPPAGTSLWRASAVFARAIVRSAGRGGTVAATLVAAAAVVDGASLLLIIPILDSVVGGSAGASRIRPMLERLGLQDPLHRLIVLLAAFVLVAVVRAIILYARDLALAKLQQGFVEGQRNRVMQVLAGAPWSRIVVLRHTHVTNLITTEVGRIASGASYLVQGLVAAALLVVQGALAFALAPVLATAVSALVVVGGGAVMLAQGRIRDLGAALVTRNAALMGSADGFLGGLKAATAQNAQASFVAEFETLQRDLRDGVMAFVRRQAAGRRVFSIGSGVAAAAVVLVGFMLHVPPAILVTLVLIFARMSGPAIQLQMAAQNFVFALPAFEAMQRFEQDLADRADAPAPVTPPPGAIVLHGVRYLHAGGGGIDDATLTIAPGSFVGVAGPSGAGKTTLVDLLIGLLEPQAGTIAVGGIVLDAATRAGLRDYVAYVPQESFLFHDSVRRNLSWGNGAPDDAALWAALDLAEVESLIRRLPGGLETIVGERGTLLSGGERQRLALARAVLRRPRLLVLDEAMNAIDADSESVLLDRLARLDPRPTIVMISHRAASFAGCDHVIRVENGVAT